MFFTWAFPCVGLPRMGGLLAALTVVWLPGMAAGATPGCLRFYASLLSRGCGRDFWFLA